MPDIKKPADTPDLPTAQTNPGDLHDRPIDSSTCREEPVEEASFQERLDLVADTIEGVRMLAVHSLEFQQIMALLQVVLAFPNAKLAEHRINLLNVIDTHWDLYKRKFNLPDRLVCLKFETADGPYFLSLSRGYLCLYQHPFVRHPLAMPLVWPEKEDYNDQSN